MGDQTLSPGDVVAGRFRISGEPRRAGGVLLCEAVEIVSGDSVQLAVCADPEPAATDEFLARAKRITALSRASIASVREILLEGDGAVAVCDAPSGVDLWAWRRALGRAPTAAEFDKIAGQLLETVSALHGAGALHLRITPGAITIGADGHATLAPFGAPFGDDAEADAFSPPEIAAGWSTPAGERSDVFSCAATLTALISGGPPPNAGGLPAPVAAAGSDIRPEALQALAIALSPNPSDRPPSVRALAALLFDFSSDPRRAPSAATPGATVKPPPQPRIQRSRGTATWGALAALAILLLGGLYALDFSPPWREMARRARGGPPELALRSGETAPEAPASPMRRAEDPKLPSLPPKADSIEKPEAKAPPEPRKDAPDRLPEVASMTDRDALVALAKEGTPASQPAKARLESLGYILARGGAAPVWLKPGEGEIFRDCAECPELVLIPAGEFLMGSASNEPGRNDDEDDTPGSGGSPVAIKIAAPFAVSRSEITRGEYAAFAADTRRSADGGCFGRSGALKLDPALSWRDPGFPQDDRHPVVCVNYEDARAYAEWLSNRAGVRYRLPSEAEWEYAARGGASIRARYFFGDGVEDLCAYANGADATAHERNADWVVAPCRDGFAWTAPVGSFRPNGFGLRDMLGNVWEWTSDCASDSLSHAARGGPAGCAPEANRILRGGSWSDPPARLRPAARVAGPPAARDQIVGFRLVRELAR
ncbi:SUMF1/EgtB/PvdO family nonheme iron enzyme [Rhodoblastus sp.]|jgi:formylglycine-generating enzyme required for sulfatase activity|uniref:SUMF1/EgtB/PvdO family nonheme iron enzyme n=1 Tax=Rhodoblastus sp. TaxID=1962975 RepID=UPI0025E53CCC|nr:SUMF1/EgtB/PvdO family nonheme iron enzyme [Rhodoblastus sp.]